MYLPHRGDVVAFLADEIARGRPHRDDGLRRRVDARRRRARTHRGAGRMSGDLALARDILRSLERRPRAGRGSRCRRSRPFGSAVPPRCSWSPRMSGTSRRRPMPSSAPRSRSRSSGKGSNVLVADAGFPGLVLRLGRGFRWTARDGDVVQAGGAMPLPALAGVALHHGFAGLAFAVAIPASLGGVGPDERGRTRRPDERCRRGDRALRSPRRRADAPGICRRRVRLSAHRPRLRDRSWSARACACTRTTRR